MDIGSVLPELWETYAQLARRRSEKHAIQQRHVILDKFLRLHLVVTAGPSGAPRFGNMKNVSSQLSQELMSDILTISNSANDENDSSQLQQYLLKGRGWKLLHVMHNVGVETIPNSRDLCNLLLSLLPYCVQFESTEPEKESIILNGRADKWNPVQQCFVHTTRSSKLKHFGFNKDKRNCSNHPKYHVSEWVEHRKRKYTKLAVTSVDGRNSDSEDEMDKKDKKKHLRSKRHARLTLFKTPGPQEDEDSGSDHDLLAAFPDYPGAQEIVSSAELILIMLDLLFDLCALDLQQDAPDKIMSPIMLPHLLPVLTSVSQKETDSNKTHWSMHTKVTLHRHLLRLIFTVNSIIATQQSGVKTIVGHNTVSAILSSITLYIVEDELDNPIPCEGAGDLLQDVIYGLNLMFEAVFESLPFNPSLITSALSLLDTFKTNKGFKYIKMLVTGSEMEETSDIAEMTVKSVSSLISTLKLIKINYIHTVKCLKRKHKHCEYDLYLSHHHNILGYPSGMDFDPAESSGHKSFSSNPTKCQVSVFTSLLLEMLAECKSCRTQVQILSTLRHPGICCCMHPKFVVESLTRLLPVFNPYVRSVSLEVLNEILLDQFLGSHDNAVKLSEVNVCKLCMFDEGQPITASSETTLSDISKMMDSGFCSSDGAKRLWTLQRWRSLQIFRQYVTSTDESLALVTSKHLIVLAIRGNNAIKHELFFKVYQHVVHSSLEEMADMTTSSLTDTSSDEQLIALGKVPSSIMLYCLSALPYLLQVDIVMNAFVEKEGLSRLNTLLEDPNLRAPVMGVFEALIMIDEQKVREMTSKTVEEVSQMSTEYFRGTVMQNFIDLLAKKTCAITAAFQSLHLQKSRDEDSDNQEKPMQGVRDSHYDVIQELPLLLDMWRTCAKLCLNSVTFRTFYRNSPCLYIVQETLLLAIELMTHMVKEKSSETSSDTEQNVKPRTFSCHIRKLTFIESVMIVCFACHTVSPEQKKGAEEDSWRQLRDSLQLCVKLEPTKLKAVFDMILNVALPQLPCILEYSYSQIIAQLNLKDKEMVDEAEVHEILQLCGSEEDETNCTENGYEADTETTMFIDWKKSLQISQDNSFKHADTIHFPAVFRLFVELAIACQRCPSAESIIVSVMLRLLQTLRNSPPAVVGVCSEGVLEVVLNGFRSSLVNKPADPHEQALSEILLSLVQILAQTEMSATELRLYLRLFQEDGYPLESLLSTLMSIVERSQVKPCHSVTFPTPRVDRPTIPENMDTQQPQEVWCRSALMCEIGDSIVWPPVPSGFSVALWMNVSDITDDPMFHLPKLKKDDSASLVFSSANFSSEPKCEVCCRLPVCECLHVLSVGSTNKMFEVWADVRSRSFIFRITTAFGETEVMKELSSDRVFSPGIWHHVVISYEEKLNGSTLVGKVLLIIDGCISREIILDYPANFSRKPQTSSPKLLLGHIRDNADLDIGQWHLGNIMMFKGADLSREWWFHHYALGPNLTSVGKCDCSKMVPSYTPYLSKAVLTEGDLSLDFLVGAAALSDAEKARTSFVLSYCSTSPRRVSHYSANDLQKMLSDLGLLHPTVDQDSLLFQLPRVQAPFDLGRLETRTHSTLELAIDRVGGVQAFLFLMAKTYESCKNVESEKGRNEAEHIQSKVLRLVLSLIHHLPQLAVEFHDVQGYAMIQKVLVSSRSVVGYEILKALLDSCVSESLFRPDASMPKPILRQGTEAVVQDVAVINQLLLYWRIWDKADEDVVELLFEALQSLVRPSHPHRQVNIKQFRAGNIMSKIFYIYLERIQEGLPSLSREIGQSVSSIVQSMLGSPPDLHMLVGVMDFLLLLHPAASSFVIHTITNHYLQCWWANSSTASAPKRKVIVRSVSIRYKPRLDSDIQNISKNVHKNETGRSSESLQSISEDGRKSASGIDKSESSEQGRQLVTPDMQELADFPPVFPTRSVGSTPGFTHSDSLGSLEVGELTEEEEQKQEQEQTKEVQEQTSKPQTSLSESSSDSEARAGNGYEGSVDSENVQDEPQVTPRSLQKDGRRSQSCESQQTSSLLSFTDEEKADIEESFVEFDEDIKEGGSERDVGLVTVCTNLLNSLCHVLMDLQESSVDALYNKVLNPKVLIVICHNSSPQIRAAVIRLIRVYTVRAPEQHLENFLKIEGFSLLANQLHNYPARQDHIEAAVSILLEQTFTFEDSILKDEIENLSSLQQSSLVLLLCLIEQTAHDVALCHNTLSLLNELLLRCQILSSIMLEQGLMEVLTNLTAAVLRQEDRSTDVLGCSQDNLLLLDIQTVLCTLAVREFGWSGLSHFQWVEDMFSMLKALEDKETGFEDNKEQVQNTRALQYAMVVKIIEYVEKNSENTNQSQLSWLTASTSSWSSNGSYGCVYEPSPSHLHSLLPSDHFLSGSFHALLDLEKGKSPSYKLTSSSKSSDQISDQPFDEKTVSSKLLTMSCESEQFQNSYSQLHETRTRDVPARKPRVVGQSRIASFFGKRKKLLFSPVTQADMLERFKKILVLATDLVVFIDRKEADKGEGTRIQMFFTKNASLEDNYLTKLFNITYRSLEFTLEKQSTNRRYRNVITWGARDVIRQQFGRLLLCMLSTRMDFNMRLYAVSFIMGEMRGRDVIKMLIASPQLGQELGHYLYNLLTTWRDWLVSTQREHGCVLLNLLRQHGFNIFKTEQKLSQEQKEVLVDEKNVIDNNLRKAQQDWQRKKEAAADRILRRHEKHIKHVSEQAMGVTQSVTLLQNEQRKKLIDHIKKSMTEQIQLKKSWQELVQKLTHERAVWYHPAAYPHSWQLDPTEGPGRIRKRLQRCHIGLDERYLTEGYKHDVVKADAPLIYLFEDDSHMSDSAALLYRLHTNNKIQHTCRCTAVSPASENKGELLVGEMEIFFVADEAITDANYTQVLFGNREQLSMTWPHADIKELHKRWFQLQDVGLEIFLTNGRTCLLAFASTKDRDDLYHHLAQNVELPNLLPSENLDNVQRMWLNGSITNYDYLTYLNKMSGRSFNDLMQYPVFPFILRDYESDELNLDDPQTYRLLHKPIAVQEKSREKKYKENYEFLSQEYEKSYSPDEYIKTRPYHYGSHYSNSGTVLHYLVRLPPFTKMFLSYQDKSFDIPDRTFHSLATSYRLSSFESTSDVKELIPEFFFLPEFLRNSEGYNFGKRQNGETVWDVTLPPWSQAKERLFVLVHRQALESAYVTQRIHQWIDLVFGFKQQGEQAFRAINVFHPFTYFGVDVSKFTDPLKRQAVLTMIKTYGQTPKQLFPTPHPQRRLSTSGGDSSRDVQEPRPIININGLRWGNFIGSPETGTPVFAWREEFNSVITSLVPVPPCFVYGLGANSCALLYAKDRVDVAVNVMEVMWTGIISWGHSDHILRVKNKFKGPKVNFLAENPYDKVLCCASVPDCRLLFTAGTAGIISVYQVTYNRAKASYLQVYGSRTVLYGHTGPINVLCVCKEYSILVSGSDDATCIIWDLNRLSYIRSITSHSTSVKTLAVSDTLGDIASVSPRALGSFLQLHTINGEYVASQKCDEFTINCLSFSRAPEGRSINILAGGLSTGVVRLWSTWDLTVIRDLSHDLSIARPVVSVTFTHDSQRLFVSAEDGSVTMWEKPHAPKLKSKIFISFLDEDGKS